MLDIDAERLSVVGGFAQRMLDYLDWTGRLTLTGDRESAIDGADFVLIQLRVGGQATRLIDETLPPRFGVIGQETTGAGGFAKALRTVPVVLELAELTSRRAAPGAWIVDFTNPVGIVTQALLDEGHRAIGLCNVAINVQRTLAKRLGVAAHRVDLEHVGLNHLSWERAAFVDGVDRLPELLATDADWLADHVGMPVDPGPRARRDPVLLPALLLRDREGGRGAAKRAHPGPGRHGHRGSPARSLSRSRARREAGVAGRSRRCVLQRGGRPADRLAARRGRRSPGGRHPERRRAPRPARFGGRRDPGHDRPRRRASAAPAIPSPRRCAASSRRPRPTRS